MKALVYRHYGSPDVFSIEEAAKPVPGNSDVLVKVRATTVNRTDCATIRAKPFFARVITGLFKPKKQIPGTEFAGQVIALGRNVTNLSINDNVFGFDDSGTKSHAEYLLINQSNLLTMPESITYQQAAACSEGAHYALNFINKVAIMKGQTVLVNGATGAIGSAAVQLLKHFELHVTATCATKNIDLVRNLGADHVIDYTQQDFTKIQVKFDYVFDTVGKSTFFKCKNLLKSGGIYISSDLGPFWQNLYLPMFNSFFKRFLDKKQIRSPFPKDIPATLALIKNLVEKNEFKPVIDCEYRFEGIIEAYQYVEKGHKTGNVVISMD